MLIYYIIFFALLFFAVNFDVCPFRLAKDSEFAFFAVLVLFLMLIAGLRATGLENDYTNYKMVFEEISQINSLSDYSGYSVEYGYKILNRIFSGCSYYTFTMALTFFTVLPKVFYIYKNASKKFIALFYYYCLVFIQNDMGLIRQSIASGILLYSIDYIVNRQRKKFLLTVLFASLFHASSFFFVILWFIGDKKYTLRKYLYFIAAGILLASTHIPKYAINFTFAHLAGISMFTNKISTYIQGTNEWNSTALFFSSARRIFLLFVFYNVIKIMRRSNLYWGGGGAKIWIYYNMFFISVLFPILFYDFGNLASHRGTFLFRPAEIFLFSELCASISKKKISHLEAFLERLAIIILISYLGLHNIESVITGYPGYIPYKWIL